jgi:hypothetical protein
MKNFYVRMFVNTLKERLELKKRNNPNWKTNLQKKIDASKWVEE